MSSKMTDHGENAPKQGAQPGDAQWAAVNDIVNEYDGKGEDELMDELLRITAQQKKEGSFDTSAMLATANSIKPMLTPQQAKKLDMIMALLSR